MGFELFTQYGRGHRPTCSLRTNGQIGFNRGSIERFDLGTEFVKLYYDRDSRLIGIQVLGDTKVDNSTKLIVKKYNAFISARSFLDFYGIEYRSATSTYEVRRDESADMLIIDLKMPMRHARSARGDEKQ